MRDMTFPAKQTVGREDGFTMVELLVVLAILGLLVAIAVPAYIGFTGRSADTAAKANLRATLPSAEAYYLDNGTYVGMTVDTLRARYDAGLARGLAISGTPSATSYCVANTVAGHSWSVSGPGVTSASFKNNSSCS
jgi:prepilin-type N-terminal cleavage/methylation domain-containing protein